MISNKLFNLQKDIAVFLLNKLENMEITPERAAKTARYVSNLLKSNLTDEQVILLTPKLKENFPELSEIIQLQYQKEEDKNKSQAIASAEKLIKEGKIDQAQKALNSFT